MRRWGEGGRRFVLLHGLPVDGGIWEGVGAALAAAGHTALAPDLPGYGGSPAGGDTLAAHRTWLDEVVGPGRCCLVGHDYGGLLAADFVARRSGEVTSLALSSTLVGLLWAPIKATALPGVERLFYRRYGGRRWLDMGVGVGARPALRARYPLDDAQLPGRMRRTAWGIPLTRCAGLARAVRDSAVPVTCIWGADDRSIPLWAGHWTAASTGARLHVIPGARHYVMVKAAEAFAAALLQNAEGV